ncbi:MAG: hypothetical protein ACPG5B_07095 [Chitinophagales bacterium]
MCLLLFSSLLIAFTPATISNYELVSSVPLEAHFMTTDFLKSAYVITNKNQVMKYDSTGNLIGNYSENRYGQLTSIDAKSPFNVLMFYKEFSTLVSVDMRMSARRLYKLSSVDLNNIAAACLSDDNYIWLYDMDAGRLKKINHAYETIYQSVEVPQLVGQEVEPNFMMEKDGLIYLNIPKVGVMMFDIYGTYYTSVSVNELGFDDLESFQVLQHKILYFKEGHLFIYDVFQQEIDSYPIPKSLEASDVKVEKGRLYMLDEEQLQFYKQK